MKRVVTLAMAFVALCVTCDCALGARLVTPAGQRARPYQGWADRSLMPTAPGLVTVLPAPCPYIGGSPCYFAEGRRVYMSLVLPRDMERARFLHELGHDFDAYVMTRESRGEFRHVLGYHGPWNPERFAEAYSICSLRRTVDYWTFAGPHYGYRATPWQHLHVCALIRRVGTVGAGHSAPGSGNDV